MSQGGGTAVDTPMTDETTTSNAATVGGDDTASPSSAPPPSLRCREFEFMSLWDRVAHECDSMLRHPYNRVPPRELTRLSGNIYRLASNPCTKTPILVRGSQNDKVQTRDPIAQQCLVLYYMLRELLKTHLDARVYRTLRECQEPNLVSSYVTHWNEFTISIRKVRAVFAYLEDHWHSLHMHSTASLFNTTQIALTGWNDIVLTPLSRNLSHALLDIVSKDRQRQVGQPTEALTSTPSLQVLGEALRSLQDFDQHLDRRAYHDYFESQLLRSVAKFYGGRSSSSGSSSSDDDMNFRQRHWRGGQNVKNYLIEVEKAMRQEEWRANECMLRGTGSAIKRTILDFCVLPEEFVEPIISTTLNWIGSGDSSKANSDEEEWPSVRRSCGILSSDKRSMERLAAKFAEHVAATGHTTIAQLKESDVLADMSLVAATQVQLYSRFEGLVTDIFKGDETIKRQSLDKGVKGFLNCNAFCKDDDTGRATSVVFLARYFHALLCTCSPASVAAKAAPVDGFTNPTEGTAALTSSSSSQQQQQSLTVTQYDAADVDHKIRIALCLFVHIQDKDIFQHNYLTLLTRRLIYTPFNAELERNVVERFQKTTDSPEYVNKWRVILNEATESARQDLLSQDLNKLSVKLFDFHNYPVANVDAPRLKDNSWALHSSLAASLSAASEAFAASSTFTKRRLRWIPASSYGTITLSPTHFPQLAKTGFGPVDVEVSYPQLSLLTNFLDAREGASTATTAGNSSSGTAAVGIPASTLWNRFMATSPPLPQRDAQARERAMWMQFDRALRSLVAMTLLRVPPLAQRSPTAMTAAAVAGGSLVLPAALTRDEVLSLPVSLNTHDFSPASLSSAFATGEPAPANKSPSAPPRTVDACLRDALFPSDTILHAAREHHNRGAGHGDVVVPAVVDVLRSNAISGTLFKIVKRAPEGKISKPELVDSTIRTLARIFSAPPQQVVIEMTKLLERRQLTRTEEEPPIIQLASAPVK